MMRLVQYFLKNDPQTRKIGVRIGTNIIDLQKLKTNFPNNVVDLLRNHRNELEELESMNFEASSAERHSMDEITLLSPITNPDKVICVGMNYKDHCEEQNVPVPKEPIFFSKFPSSIIGPFQPIRYPEVTEQLDYEVELAFIIGKEAKNVPQEKAMDYVFGYTVAHDVSARDWQFNKNGGQWLLGKTMDDFCPLGPEIATKSEIPNPHALPIKCSVNGVVKQNSNTGQIVFGVETLVSYLTKCMTLLPGDIILTGTPPGVGVFQKPPLFLKKGDVVECEIEPIGKIRNEIVSKL